MTCYNYNNLRKEDNRQSKSTVSQEYVILKCIKYTDTSKKKTKLKKNDGSSRKNTKATYSACNNRRLISIKSNALDVLLPCVIYVSKAGQYVKEGRDTYKIKEVSKYVTFNEFYGITNPWTGGQILCFKYILFYDLDIKGKRVEDANSRFFTDLDKICPNLDRKFPSDIKKLKVIQKKMMKNEFIRNYMFDNTIYYKLRYVESLYNQFKGIVFSKTFNISKLEKELIYDIRKTIKDEPWKICLHDFRTKFKIHYFKSENIQQFISQWIKHYYCNNERIDHYKTKFGHFIYHVCIIECLIDAMNKQCTNLLYNDLEKKVKIAIQKLNLTSIQCSLDNTQQMAVYKLLVCSHANVDGFTIKFKDAMEILCKSGDVNIFNDSVFTGKTEKTNNVYLGEIFNHQKDIIQSFGKMYKNLSNIDPFFLRDCLEDVEDTIEKKGDRIDKDQREYYRNVFKYHKHPLSALLGRAGAGKTETMGHVIRTILKTEENNVLCCAFQGSAKKVLYDRIAKKIIPKKNRRVNTYKSLIGCMTIHKFIAKCRGLKFANGESADEPEPYEWYDVEQMEASEFAYFYKNLKYVVIDEISTVSLPLFAKLLKQLPDINMVLVMGDKEQIKSIEVGNLIESLMKSFGKHPGSKLQFKELTVNNRFGMGPSALRHNMNLIYDKNLDLIKNFKFGRGKSTAILRFRNWAEFTKLSGKIINKHKDDRNSMQFYTFNNQHIKLINDNISNNIEAYRCFTEIPNKFDLVNMHMDLLTEKTRETMKKHTLFQGMRILCTKNTNSKIITNCFILKKEHYKALRRYKGTYTGTDHIIRGLLNFPVGKLEKVRSDYCSNGTIDVIDDMQFGCRFYGKTKIKPGDSIRKVMDTHTVMPIIIYTLHKSGDQIVVGGSCVQPNDICSGIATSVNKMQGNQSKICIFVIPPDIEYGLTFYGYNKSKLLVSLTRSEKKLYILVGDNTIALNEINRKRKELKGYKDEDRTNELSILNRMFQKKCSVQSLQPLESIQLIAMNREPKRFSNLHLYLMHCIKQNVSLKRKNMETDRTVIVDSDDDDNDSDYDLSETMNIPKPKKQKL